MDKLLSPQETPHPVTRLGELLGSRTRGNVIEALALSEKPLSAYRVAKTYNMNVAKVYQEMKRLSELGLLKVKEGPPAREYELSDENLKGLALSLTTRVQTYESWRGADSKRARFRMGLRKVPEFEIGDEATVPESRRMPGELENLAKLGRTKFDSKYKRVAVRAYARV
jgi:predicted transcriptional regulator